MVRQYAIVHEGPTKGVGDDDDDSLHFFALIWLRNVAGTVEDLVFAAFGSGFVRVAAEAGGTGHFDPKEK